MAELTVRRTDRPAVGLCVLCGWWGAQTKQVQKYEDIYLAEGFDVVHTVALRDHQDVLIMPLRFRGVARRLCAWLCERRNEVGEQPLVVQVMSNGGGLLYWALMPLLKENGLKVSALIFDSSPGWLNLKSGSRASIANVPVPWRGAARLAVVALFARVLFVILMILRRGFATRRRAVRGLLVASAAGLGIAVQAVSDSRYQHALANDPARAPTLFLYSADDAMIDPACVEQLAAARQRLGVRVKLQRWEQSEHVLHLRHHPEQYIATLRRFLTDSLAPQRSAACASHGLTSAALSTRT
eukprot:TRINITY_DN22907_c0_g1_i1.p1 TRINITY_DN22907_c0_g1~~TRINITY_DN22907_c0_g1_i1.p1  ORF type:complete len:320 (+),score=71.14 TRINITY_DN22907_c0_g1_i1:69-962(+)